MSSELEALCRACGLCCDGSLFEVVALSPVEATALEAHGVPVEHRDGGRAVLRQRCGALPDQGFDCRCYAVRPSTCRRFVCLLAHARAAGEVSHAGAVAIVADARARLARGEGPTGPFFERYFAGR